MKRTTFRPGPLQKTVVVETENKLHRVLLSGRPVVTLTDREILVLHLALDALGFMEDRE